MSPLSDANSYQHLHNRVSISWLRIVLLPALLLLTVYVAFGFYFDTNDDTTLKLILQGKAADSDASSLHYVYYPIWSNVLIFLYDKVPGFPWYDWLMVGFVYASLVTFFYILETMLGRMEQSGFRVGLVEVLFFAVTFPLHVLQANFTRPAILLGAAAVTLLTIPEQGNRSAKWRWAVAGLLFVAGWGTRPDGAMLGAFMVAPLLFMLLKPRLAVKAGLYLAAITILLNVGNALRQTAADKGYIAVQKHWVVIVDFERVVMVPQTLADSVAASSLKWGAVPFDSSLINESFFRRCVKPQSLAAIKDSRVQILRIVLRDTKQWALGTFGLVALGGLLVWWYGRQPQGKNWSLRLLGYVLYQLFFATVYLGLSLWLKHVPRVAQPILSIYLISNLLLLVGLLEINVCALPKGNGAGLVRWAYLGIIGCCALLSVERSWRLYLTESFQEKRHAAYLQRLYDQSAGTIIVEASLDKITANLKFFKDYHLQSYTKFITLLNWPKSDPGQQRLLRALTNQPDVASALLALGHKSPAEVTWLLEPYQVSDISGYLNLKLHRSKGQQVHFDPVPSKLPAGEGPQQYVLVDEKM